MTQMGGDAQVAGGHVVVRWVRESRAGVTRFGTESKEDVIQNKHAEGTRRGSKYQR